MRKTLSEVQNCCNSNIGQTSHLSFDSMYGMVVKITSCIHDLLFEDV